MAPFRPLLPARLLGLALALLPPALALAEDEGAPRIAEIRAHTDGRTHEDTIVGYSRLDVGDAFGPKDAARAERYLVATGLFKEVQLTTEPADEGRVRVLIEVTEKISWVIAPTFAASSSNVGGGLIYAENNLWGRSKKFIVGAQVTSNESGIFVGYLDPNLFDWPALRLSVEGQLKSDRVQEYEGGAEVKEPAVLRTTRVNLGGVASEFTINWFETFRTAVKYRYSLVHPLSPSPDSPVTSPAQLPHETQTDATLRLVAGIDTRQTLGPIMEGLNLEGSYEISREGLGSDFDYEKVGALYRQGIRLFTEQNLVLRAEAQLGQDLPFYNELTTGGLNLRGFLHRQFRGDTKASFTAEYHFPLFRVSALSVRGVAFSDTALTYFRHLPDDLALLGSEEQLTRGYLPNQREGVNGGQLTQGVGAGLRLYLSNIVLPLLGVDVAYGVNPGEVRIYVVAGVAP
ncbi:BamA/TamA family outer membrane protein [Aggregicoccus sp. 17bor-14]|uniref:BamA/TamA family outer membrane protein n=1 Tax=Myxococcaceae TaxID=31 RepID=UPI00129CC757|nr:MULTISPECIES: BamA/TamA family outer membrane protein [Myxococcaceae]MBF5040776.1 BamA/TamA family outer membrane protein [Simulacricoccus sp. 17bor-14]MRI86564.1 BamA/TamA family outer membrane protein [Aggregicoccus sp. 17bor-14]